MRVTISTNKYSILLRWSYLKKRFTLSIGEISEKNLVFAEKIKTSIEKDISRKLFDFNEYLLLATNNKIKKEPKPLPVIPTTSFLFMYQQYVEMTGNMHKKRNKLYVTLQMLNKFGDVPIDNIPERMMQMKYGATTFNERLSCLKKASNYLVRTGKILYNPFLEVKSMKRSSRNLVPERMPFTVQETNLILDALKSGKYNRNCMYYYSFVKFLFLTGVRNAEAIGLTMEKLNFLDKTILINQSFARTDQGTNKAARIMKTTKTDNARYIPLSDELEDLLKEIITNKRPKEFVFTTIKGSPIDDHQFQLRIWNRMLYDLGLSHRNLYAIRHTFGTRAIEQGLNPKEVQYLMGHADVRITLDVYVTLTTRVDRLPKMF